MLTARDAPPRHPRLPAPRRRRRPTRRRAPNRGFARGRGRPRAPRARRRRPRARAGRACRARIAAIRSRATSGDRSSTTTRSGTRPADASSLSCSTSATPRPRPTPWYASDDGMNRSLTTHAPCCKPGRTTSAMCSARSAAISSASTIGSTACRVVEEERSQLRAERGGAGLEGLDHLVAGLTQACRESAHLRALPGRVATFEHHEVRVSLISSTARFARSCGTGFGHVVAARHVGGRVTLGPQHRVSSPEPGCEGHEPATPERDANPGERVRRTAEGDRCRSRTGRRTSPTHRPTAGRGRAR